MSDPVKVAVCICGHPASHHSIPKPHRPYHGICWAAQCPCDKYVQAAP